MNDDVPAVEAVGLRRVYRRRGRPPVVALEDFSLSVPAGEVHGLLGPNGAGKTTLCKILSTVLIPSAGTARLFGYDVVERTSEVRALIGIVFGGERGLYGMLTARQNLRYWSALQGRSGSDADRHVDALLARVGLVARADERVETFSRGMKQRVHLARGLVGDPRVVVLDEPTAGMDPVAAREFRELVNQLRQEERTVLITTHDMAEAEAVCDRVSIVDDGTLIATEDPRRIGAWISTYERVEAEDVPDDVLAGLRDAPGVSGVTVLGAGRVRIETSAEGRAAEIVSTLLTAGVTQLSTSRPSLEEVYFHVMGKHGLRVR